MMNFNTTQSQAQAGIGFLAGLAAALLASGVLVQSGLAMVLYVLTPLPILIAALGWGTLSGIFAVLVAGLAVSIFAAPMAALLIALTSLFPALFMAYYAGLARPVTEIAPNFEAPHDTLLWYPLPDILFRLALLIAASFVLIGFIIGYGPELASQLSNAVISNLEASDPAFTASDDFRSLMQNFLLIGLPAFQTASFLLIMVGNFYLALRITERSGHLRRPRDNWPATLRMPRQALLAFAVFFAGSMFLSGPAGMISTAFAGALAMGFILSGLAIIHWRTRGATWRVFALWMIYFVMILISFTALIFLVIGLLDTSRGAPLSKKLPEQD